MVLFDVGTRGDFLALYREVFGADFTGDIIPPEITIARDADTNEVVGFMAGHINFDGSFYIQSSGVLPKYREQGLSAHFKHLLMDHVSYICVTDNENVAAMRVLLAVGFKPMGMRQGKKELFIEWCKEKCDA
jgi:hypothetical protein